MRAHAKDRVEYAVLQEEFSTEQLDELIALIVEMESCHCIRKLGYRFHRHGNRRCRINKRRLPIGWMPMGSLLFV